MHIFDLIILIAGFSGFSISLYIASKKMKKKPLVCSLKSDCNNVINSDFSKFLGIPLEFLGIAYYAIIVLGHAALLAIPALVTPLSIFISLILSSVAFLFSLYLISIQAFALKSWCTWCLASAFFSIIIFIFTLMGSPFPSISLLADHSMFFTILHLFGVILGVGSATFTDIFFFRFLKDYRISEDEAETLKIFSQVIWLALGLLIFSGIGLFLPKSAELLASGKFLVKMTAVAVLIFNGFILNKLIQPKLAKITFGISHSHMPGELHRLRKLSFALGAVSLTSWYFIFVLGALRGIVIAFEPLLLGYVILLSVAVFGSQIFDKHIIKVIGRDPGQG